MLQRFDGWVSAAPPEEEKQYLIKSMRFLREAAEIAIDQAQPSIPDTLELSLKRAKIN
jgi:hypothetical protein